MARRRDPLRWLAIGALLALLLFAVRVVIAPPALPESAPAAITLTPPSSARPSPTPTQPVAPTAMETLPADTDAIGATEVAPQAEDEEWLRQGADAPPCGTPARPPSRMPAGADCTEGALAIICAAPLTPGTTIPSVSEVEKIVGKAGEIVGRSRATPLYVMIHDERTWADLAAAKRLPKGIVGLYDGTVHLSPQSDPDERAETLDHEVFHGVLDSAIRCVPRSMHEGLASWFAGEFRENAWMDSLKHGFWGPEDLEVAVGRSTHPTDRAAGYGQAEARVSVAVEKHGVTALPVWIGWLGAADRDDPVAAWDQLDVPTESELKDHVSGLLFGAPYDPALLRAWQEKRLRCEATASQHGPPRRECRPVE
jgi:hypothetical protein